MKKQTIKGIIIGAVSFAVLLFITLYIIVSVNQNEELKKEMEVALIGGCLEEHNYSFCNCTYDVYTDYYTTNELFDLAMIEDNNKEIDALKDVAIDACYDYLER